MNSNRFKRLYDLASEVTPEAVTWLSSTEATKKVWQPDKSMTSIGARTNQIVVVYRPRGGGVRYSV